MVPLGGVGKFCVFEIYDLILICVVPLGGVGKFCVFEIYIVLT